MDQNFWFNPLAFAAPAAGTFGNSGKNIIRGPMLQTWDIALFKNVPLGGTRRLQLRLEVVQLPRTTRTWTTPRARHWAAAPATS